MRDQMFVIWNWEHQAWWAPDQQGYTEQLAQAGRYTFDEAAEIIIGHIPAGEEVAMVEAEALQTGIPIKDFVDWMDRTRWRQVVHP